MADPFTRILRDIVRKVLERERAKRKKGEGTVPENIAIQCLREIVRTPVDPALVKLIPGCAEILPAFPLLYLAAKSCDLEQLTRQELRRWPEERGFGTRKEGDDGDEDESGAVAADADDKKAVGREPTLPGFEEFVKNHEYLHPEYPKAHQKGQKPVYVPFPELAKEDWVWNVRFIRNLIVGNGLHLADLLAAGLELRGWEDPDKKPDKKPEADIG